MHSTIMEEAASSYSSSSSSSSFVLHASAMPSPKKKAGRRKFKETRHPVYRGVRQRNGDKWVCELREPNKKTRLWLGTYPTPEMAARAHDVAAIALRGDSALLNFPHSACALPRPVSASPTDIRRAAAKAAALPVSMTATTTTTPVVANGEPEMFLDEEALFNMPRLLDDMAAGLLLTPPGWKQQHDDDGNIGMDSHMDFSLWG